MILLSIYAIGYCSITKFTYFKRITSSLLACLSAADVGFILDASASVDETEYLAQKNAVKDMVTLLHQSGDDFRDGLIQFSEFAQVIYHFNDDFRTVNVTVDNMDRVPSITRLDRALRLSQSSLFQTINGDRPNVPNVLWIMVDGTQTEQQDSEDPVTITNEIRNNGVDVYVVGIGEEVTRFELEQLAGGRPERVFYAASFDVFNSIAFIERMVKAACPGKL